MAEILKTTASSPGSSSSPYLNEFRITLETDAVALYVWLETSEGKKIGIIYAWPTLYFLIFAYVQKKF